MKRVSLIFGTRPEAIKLCPVILEMKAHSVLEPHVCVTAQHREMLEQVLGVFGVVPDVDLNLMSPNQTLAGLSSRAITAIDSYLTQFGPDLVLVQGDTTTVFCAVLCAFYHGIPLGHVEAGLRTGDSQSPFPEEANRVLTSRLATLHFAPREEQTEPAAGGRFGGSRFRYRKHGYRCAVHRPRVSASFAPRGCRFATACGRERQTVGADHRPSSRELWGGFRLNRDLLVGGRSGYLARPDASRLLRGLPNAGQNWLRRAGCNPVHGWHVRRLRPALVAGFTLLDVVDYW